MSPLLGEVGSAWIWLVAGLALAGCELLAPGVFLIWLGIAAMVTSGITALGATPWQAQILVFAGLSVASVLIGRRLAVHPASTLNRRGHDLVGQTVLLAQPIVGGVGRSNQGDVSWRLTGPDLPAGARVRITGLDGTTLRVEPIGE